MLVITKVTRKMASKSVGTYLVKQSCDACYRRMQTTTGISIDDTVLHILYCRIRLRADKFTKHNCDTDAISHSCDTIASLNCFAIKNR